MKNILSSLAFVLLFLGLGAVVLAAVPDGSDAAQPADAPALLGQTQEDPAVEPQAPAASPKYNDIALPLDMEAYLASLGHSYDADGLADYVGSSVQEVNTFNEVYQAFDVWYPNLGYGFVDGGSTFSTTPFPLAVAGSYWILVDSTADTTLTMVGDVPPQGSVDFTFHGASTCLMNTISLPLDQGSITDASLLATSVGSATEQVLDYNAQFQAFDVWYPNLGYGFVDGGTTFTTTPFATSIGQPYWLCLTTAADGQVWP